MLVVAFPLVATAAGCGADRKIRFLDSVRLDDPSRGLSEPSGLTLAADDHRLWTISDDTSRIFLIGTDGNLKPKHTINTGLRDLEGVAYDPRQNRLLVISEADTEIVTIDLASNAMRRYPLSAMAGYDAIKGAFLAGDPNDGLEGIAIDRKDGTIFLIKQRNPRLLLRILPDLSEIRDVRNLSAALGFVDDDKGDDRLDVSGLAAGPTTECLWILSDSGQRLYLFDPAARVAQSYGLTWLKDGRVRPVTDAEGIAFDPEAGRLYIVNDKGKRSRLFTYEVGQPDMN